MSIRHSTMDTPLGDLTLVATGEAISGLYFPQHKHPPTNSTLGAEVRLAADPTLAELGRQLQEYLAGERHDFNLPVAPVGTDLQRQVWALIAEIPYGQTRTYGELAARLDGPLPERMPVAKMVGQAVGRNPVSIVIPCHRVMGADGTLTGFAGGLDRKRWLLDLEEPADAAASRLF